MRKLDIGRSFFLKHFFHHLVSLQIALDSNGVDKWLLTQKNLQQTSDFLVDIFLRPVPDTSDVAGFV